MQVMMSNQYLKPGFEAFIRQQDQGINGKIILVSRG